MKKLLSTRYSDNSFSLALFILRMVAGGLMIPHGYGKLVNFSELASKFGDPFHIGSTITLVLVIFAEFFCASLVVLGLLTRLACIPLVINMSVALVWAHDSKVFGDGEMATLFLGGFLAILLVGPGKMSVDRMLGK